MMAFQRVKWPSIAKCSIKVYMVAPNILKSHEIIVSFARFDSRRGPVLVNAPLMRSSFAWQPLSRALWLALIVLILALAPFAAAQDVHHELAAADTDGHEHSDTDLCQWVQHHTSGSLDLGDAPASTFETVRCYELPQATPLFSAEFPFIGPSRAPPHS